MSQEKVELKKTEKQNMKKTVKKRKTLNIVAGICTAAIACALIVWIVYSGYGKYESSKKSAEAQSVEVDLSPITDFTSSINDSTSSN